MTIPRKILSVFGTRPEAIKLFPLIHALEADDRFESRVCVSGQHRGMLDQVLDIAGVKPDHDLDLMRPDQTLDALTANLLTGIGGVLDAENPDWVIVQGDTATAMAGALAAYYRKIPVAHVEAGLRSGNIYHPQSVLIFPLRNQAMLCVAALAVVLIARSPVATPARAKASS
jgi:UDP-N-acetylglucosamine 2-epimerase (non-hydrolysing)